MKRKLTWLRKPHLILVDEVGYGSLIQEQANLFFQFINTRYEQGSIILTTNKSFGRWTEILSDEAIAMAPLDRLLHHAHVFSLKGDSYRMKDRLKIGVVDSYNFFEKRNFLAVVDNLVAGCGCGAATALTDQGKVDVAKAALDEKALTEALGVGDLGDITADFTLPKSGTNGAVITWKVTTGDAIKLTGETAAVTRPATDDAEVQLTATFTEGTATTERVHTLMVKKAEALTG